MAARALKWVRWATRWHYVEDGRTMCGLVPPAAAKQAQSPMDRCGNCTRVIG